MKEEIKQKISSSKIGQGAKDYIAVDPEGNKIHIHNLRQWCIRFGFSYNTMSSMLRGGKPSYNGYTRYESLLSQAPYTTETCGRDKSS